MFFLLYVRFFFYMYEIGTHTCAQNILDIKDLLTAFEEEDVEKFTNVVAEYDNMTRLDAWYTTMLLRIKKQLQVWRRGTDLINAKNHI